MIYVFAVLRFIFLLHQDLYICCIIIYLVHTFQVGVILGGVCTRNVATCTWEESPHSMKHRLCVRYVCIRNYYYTFSGSSYFMYLESGNWALWISIWFEWDMKQSCYFFLKLSILCIWPQRTKPLSLWNIWLEWDVNLYPQHQLSFCIFSVTVVPWHERMILVRAECWSASWERWCRAVRRTTTSTGEHGCIQTIRRRDSAPPSKTTRLTTSTVACYCLTYVRKVSAWGIA